MAIITNTTTGLTDQFISAKYSNVLLTHAVDLLEMAKFAHPGELPRNAGSTTMRFFKRAKADGSNVQTLTQTAAINTFSNTTLTPVDVTLTEYGDVTKIAQSRRWVDIFDQLDIEVTRQGEDAAIHLETLIRNSVIAGVTSAAQKIYAGGAATWAALDALTNANGKLTTAEIKKAATRLKLNRAPKFMTAGMKPHYVAFTSPQGCYDLSEDAAWQRVREYQDKEAIYNGEIGKIHGVKVIEITLPFIEETAGGEGTYNAAGDIYSCIVVGKESYVCPKLAGSDSPLKPQFIYNSKADKSDPLNQFATAGWKGYYSSEVLDQNWIVVIRHRTIFA